MANLEIRTLISIIFSVFLLTSSAFQSDELLVDDEEFGLEGGVRTRSLDLDHLNPIRTPAPQSTTRKRSSDHDSDSKVQFLLEHAFGDSDFAPAGTFSARLKTWNHGGQTLTKLRFSRDDFTELEKKKFEKLLEDDDFYRIRLPSHVLSPPGKDYVLSSVKAQEEASSTSPKAEYLTTPLPWLQEQSKLGCKQMKEEGSKQEEKTEYHEGRKKQSCKQEEKNRVPRRQEAFKIEKNRGRRRKKGEKRREEKRREEKRGRTKKQRVMVLQSRVSLTAEGNGVAAERCLARDSLDEHFVIHTEGVNILGVNYGSPASCQYPRPLHHPKKWIFKSHTVLKSSEQAPRAPVFTEDIFNGETVEGDLIPPPERTFWAKYWMYLIPLGLIVMNGITQTMNMPEEQGAGQPPTQATAAVRRR